MRFIFSIPRKITHTVLTFLIGVALSASLAPAQSPNPPATKPQALPPAQYIPVRNYDTRHIALDLRFDWDKEQTIGTAKIIFAPLVADLRSIELDAANMTFASVKLNSGQTLKYDVDASKETLRVTLDRAYSLAETITLVINYHTNGVSKEQGIGGFGRGLTFIKPRADDPHRPRQIWSQGESEYNHYWFPCFDHPNDFFTSELSATVEKPFTVISNGSLVETKNNTDGTRTFHWKIDQPHASYLTSIVVGEYAALDGNYDDIPVTSYVYPNEVSEGRASTSRLSAMVKFFSEKTGVKYPYSKYAQTVVRDFGGGMENISATTQTDMMIHDARSELDRTSDSLESHELAHQWFGDYVTCRTWADIWLNESFATYFQAMWDEHSLGRDDFLYSDVKDNQDQYYRAWERGQRRPVVTKNYLNPDAVFDAYAYPRGGAVLHMLRTYLGEDNWWRSINHYLTKYAHQPVETEQFRIAIEETTGQPMDWFFDEWVYRMGHPIFRVTQNYRADNKTLTLTVAQEQKPDPNYSYPQVTYFRTPVDIEIVAANAPRRIERVMIEPKAEQSFSFTIDAQPAIVNFDYGDALIKILNFEKPTSDLVYQLRRDEDVMGRMWALGQLVKRLKTATDLSTTDRQQIATTIGEALTKDGFWGMRLESARALTNTRADKSTASAPAVRTALLAAAKDKNARVRAGAINTLAGFQDATLADTYAQALTDQSYGVVRAAAQALGKTKSDAVYEKLTKLIDTSSWRDQIRASGLLGLAALADKRALDAGLRYAAPSNPAPVRSAALQLLSAVGADDARTFDVAAEAFDTALASGNYQILSGAAAALYKSSDPRAKKLLADAPKKAAGNPFLQEFLSTLDERMKTATDSGEAAQ